MTDICATRARQRSDYRRRRPAFLNGAPQIDRVFSRQLPLRRREIRDAYPTKSSKPLPLSAMPQKSWSRVCQLRQCPAQRPSHPGWRREHHVLQVIRIGVTAILRSLRLFAVLVTGPRRLLRLDLDRAGLPGQHLYTNEAEADSPGIHSRLVCA